jgi:hypothetical protein
MYDILKHMIFGWMLSSATMFDLSAHDFLSQWYVNKQERFIGISRVTQHRDR